MIANDNKEDDAPFTIENNVLKGKVIPFKLQYTSAGELLFDTLKNDPNFVGQVDAMTGEEETFGDMLDRAIKCALWLQKQGVTKGDIVAVCSHNTLDSFTPCLAALFIGAIVNPWDYEMNTHMARHFLNLTDPKVIFANKKSVSVALEVVDREKSQAKVVCFGGHPRTVPFSAVLSGHNKSSVANFRCAKVDDLRYTATILYSSGTTGLPKGVQLSHKAWLTILEAQPAINLNKTTPLWFSSLYWISGMLLNLKSTTSKTKKIIGPGFSEKVACEIIEKYEVTWIMLGTSMANRFARFTDLDNYDLSTLLLLYTGGAPMKQESQDALKAHLPNTKVIQGYGMTELGGVITSQLPDTVSGSCGVVCDNNELKIVDIETGVALGPNQTGEVCAKSPAMMTGYYRNPEANKTIFDADGWLHSGDLGYYNERGELFIVDRLKEIIKYRGYQISPTEIENLLQTHPAVLEVAVVGIPHPTDDEHPVAFVSRRLNKEVTAEELVDMVANNLMDHYKLRGGVQFVSGLPYTASGKISRKELREIAKTLSVS